MKKTLILFFIISNFSVFSQVEMKYNANSGNLPVWVQLMYIDNPDEGEVINAYSDYYKKNELVKNKHTQYYKRWLRSISRFSNAKPTIKTSKSSNQWECVGPWDFDKDAESRSYAPGAAHVYTVEQSVSNPNILYAGSATAGAWKTIDKGDNWSLITKDLSLNGVYAIEIDFTNPEIIYISGNGGIYKSLSNLELARMYSLDGNESKFNMFFKLMKFEHHICNQVKGKSDDLESKVIGSTGFKSKMDDTQKG